MKAQMSNSTYLVTGRKIIGATLTMSACLAWPAWATLTANSGNGTVNDSTTGLVWDQCAYGLSGSNCSIGTASLLTWPQALVAAVAANAASYKGVNDWRVPNFNELESIIRIDGYTQYEPTIDAVVFPATPLDGFWTSTTNALGPDGAWAVSFDQGYAGVDFKTGSIYLRLVRSGQYLASSDTLAAPAPDTTPDAFSFSAYTDVDLSSLAISDVIKVTGITGPSAISVAGGSYSVSTNNGQTWSAWSTNSPSAVNQNDWVAVRLTSSASYSSLSTATLTIGGVSAAFHVTTLAAPVAPTAVTSYTAASATGSGSITAAFSGGGAACTYTVKQYIAVTGHAASPPTGSAPAGLSFPQGLFDFSTSTCTPASTLAFVITYPQALPAGTVYWKYGPTASNTAPHWYQLPASIVGNTASFSITDGGLGDDDLTANGSIVDQGGPGVPLASTGVTTVPTLSEWAMILMASLMAWVGMRRVRSSGRSQLRR